MLTTPQLFRVQSLWLFVWLTAGCAGSTVVEDNVDDAVVDDVTDVESDAATEVDGLHDDVAVEPVCEAGAELAPGFSFAPAGTFVMGDTRKRDNFGVSWQAREVELTRSFIIQRTEVTQAQWLALMGANPAHYQNCGESCPVESVTFYDALHYCNALSRAEGLETCYDLTGCGHDSSGLFACPEDLFFSLDCEGYRLPTDAEWEYAARAGVATLVPTGHNFPALANPSQNEELVAPIDVETLAALDRVSWYRGNYDAAYAGCYPVTTYDGSSYCVGPQPVAQKAANRWGLYDVLGNVTEWVWDRDSFYRDDYDYFADTVDPVGPDAPTSGTFDERVLRGSSLGDQAFETHVARRSGAHFNTTSDGLGFRVARTFQCDDASTPEDGE